jgi:hypothetical protein
MTDIDQCFGTYLRHRLTLEELVDWAEQALMEGEFAEDHLTALFAWVSKGCYC